MQILIVYPWVQGISNGNEVTAKRWCHVVQSLGHQAAVVDSIDDSPFEADLLIALHAIKSGDAVARCGSIWPDCRIVVAVTGTDIYGESGSPVLDQSLALADRIVVLQEATKIDVPKSHRHKVRVVFQSLSVADVLSRSSSEPDDENRFLGDGGFEEERSGKEGSDGDAFDICVVGHLRPVKDPFLTAKACRHLPDQSRVRITQIGSAMSPLMEQTAAHHAASNDRYRWIGSIAREEAIKTIAQSDLLVNSSRIEGGAAVITEAIVVGTPVLASRISGNWGLLGDDYEGLFAVGDWRQLQTLILRAEQDPDFYHRLQRQCDARKRLFDPDFERSTWQRLLGEFS